MESDEGVVKQAALHHNFSFFSWQIEFWWSLGFCVLFFPAVIISAVVTSRFFLRMKYDDPNDIEYM